MTLFRPDQPTVTITTMMVLLAAGLACLFTWYLQGAQLCHRRLPGCAAMFTERTEEASTATLPALAKKFPAMYMREYKYLRSCGHIVSELVQLSFRCLPFVKKYQGLEQSIQDEKKLALIIAMKLEIKLALTEFQSLRPGWRHIEDGDFYFYDNGILDPETDLTEEDIEAAITFKIDPNSTEVLKGENWTEAETEEKVWSQIRPSVHTDVFAWISGFITKLYPAVLTIGEKQRLMAEVNSFVSRVLEVCSEKCKEEIEENLGRKIINSIATSPTRVQRVYDIACLEGDADDRRRTGTSLIRRFGEEVRKEFLIELTGM